MDEEWRPIQGHERYDVSNLGRIRSRVRPGEPRILRCNRKQSHGYLSVTFSPGDVMKLVHCVVLEAFVGPRPTPDHEGAHRNGVKRDNRVANLYWATPEENGSDNARLGVIKGELHGMAKLTDAAVIAIRSSTESNRQLGLRYGVSPSTISRVRSGGGWAHVVPREAA